MKTEKRPRWRWVLAVAVVLGASEQTHGQQVEPWATLKGHTGQVFSLAFSPDGRMLASVGEDGTIRLWEVLTGKERTTLKHTRCGSALAFSPDQKLLASLSLDGVVRLWDAAGRPRGSPKRRDVTFWCLCFSPDGTTLAVGGNGNDPFTGHLLLWDVRGGRERHSLRSFPRYISSICFSTDGRMLAGGGYNVVMLWEIASGKVRASLRGHLGNVWSVAFLSGDNLLASGGMDGTVRLWDVRARRQRAVLADHDLKSCSVTATGKLLASAGWDGTARLWDMATGKQLLVVKQADPISSVAFSPDRRLLAVGDCEGTIRLLSVAKLLAHKGKK
jgi:WD40 repeat protein